MHGGRIHRRTSKERPGSKRVADTYSLGVSTLARTLTGDLSLTVGANGLKNLTLVTDPAIACAIKLNDRFKMALGTWFLNLLEGIPYFQVVLVKNPSLPAIRQLFRSVILGTPPITSVTDLQMTLTGRNLSYSFTAVTDKGQKIEGGSGLPFVVTS